MFQFSIKQYSVYLVGLLVSSVGWASGLEILSAQYGGGGRFCDATYTVISSCQQNQSCSIFVGNNLCGDPARGANKTLYVRYRCGWREESAVANEYGYLNLTCGNESDDRNGYRPYDSIRIIRATYGSGNRYCAADGTIANACDGHLSCNVNANNGLCGDPARGANKVLQISYACGNRRGLRFASIGEYGNVTLSCDGRR